MGATLLASRQRLRATYFKPLRPAKQRSFHFRSRHGVRDSLSLILDARHGQKGKKNDKQVRKSEKMMYPIKIDIILYGKSFFFQCDAGSHHIFFTSLASRSTAPYDTFLAKRQ